MNKKKINSKQHNIKLIHTKNTKSMFLFDNIYSAIKKNGRIILVINHPTFRVPQASDWHFENGVQSRIISKYLSESKLSIDMTPGEKNPKKKISTI
jgi:hypothetical protein